MISDQEGLSDGLINDDIRPTNSANERGISGTSLLFGGDTSLYPAAARLKHDRLISWKEAR